jgi:hypothetical protein
MFSDPQVVTINAIAKSMPRISSSGTSSVYKMSDESLILSIGHTKAGKGRIRSLVRLDQQELVENPLTSVEDYETLSFYTVIDRPLAGFDVTKVNYLVAGLKTWLDSTAVGKLFGQES